MSRIDELLAFNKAFVGDKRYEAYAASKIPRKKLAILSCMDARLAGLLPAALGLKNGDAAIVKVAGAVALDPYDSAVRSLLVAVYGLGVEDIMVIGHHDCGVEGMDPGEMLRRMEARGVTAQAMETDRVDLNQWLRGFPRVEDAIAETVRALQIHPLLPEDVRVRGFVMDPLTGAVDEI